MKRNDRNESLANLSCKSGTNDGRAEELLAAWLGSDAYMFRSPTAWKKIIGDSERIASVDTWEMECFDDAWKDWLNTDNTYALDDKRFFDTHIKPYSCLVGICIRIH